MKKLILKYKIMLLVICLLIAFGILFLCGDKNIREFNSKMELLKMSYYGNKQIQEIDNTTNCYVIISICNKQTQAVVRSAKDGSINKAYEQVSNKIREYIKENQYEVQWVRIDFVKEIEEITTKQLKKQLEQLTQENTYRKGILLNLEGIEIILTEAELNSNKIIDYQSCEINEKILQQYVRKMYGKEITELPTKIKTFTTIGYFCDETNTTYKLYQDSLNFGRREQENLQKKDIKQIVENANQYLIKQIQEDGKFIYGYYPLKDREINNYNILRHAGSVWSLIVVHNEKKVNNAKEREKIEKTIHYLIENIEEIEEEAYTIETKDNEIKLGGNALSAIALCEYIEKFKKEEYIEIVEKLGNGIIYMQKEDGSYNHVLNYSSYTLKEQYRTVYYDGEATFALCKIYGITRNDKYLKAAEKSIRYFIKNKYTSYKDHWISYATNEITKYIDREEYYEFALKNVADNINAIYNKEYTSYIDLEMLIQCFEVYDRIKEKQINIDYMDSFPTQRFFETIEYRLKFQLNSYVYPEISMYFLSPSKYTNAFYIRQDNFRIRIDDIQHSLLGYHFYLQNFDKIQKREI